MDFAFVSSLLGSIDNVKLYKSPNSAVPTCVDVASIELERAENVSRTLTQGVVPTEVQYKL